jgi:hypothetical protein
MVSNLGFTMSQGASGFGLAITTDRMVGGAFSAGAEVDIFSLKYDERATGRFFQLPLLLRVGYHPDIGVKNLNLYLLGKAGYTLFGYSGFAFGFDLGVRYFFMPAFAVFAELGYERLSPVNFRIFTIGFTMDGFSFFQ